MSAVPSIRAFVTKELLAALRSDDPALLPLVTSLLPPPLMEAIAKTRAVGWVPFAGHMHLNRAVRQGLGPPAFPALGRRAMLRSYDQHMVKPLIEGTLRLFGASPAGLSKVLPRLWGVMTRAGGELALEPPPGPNRALLGLTGFPAEQGFADLLVPGLGGALSSVFDLCDLQGEVVTYDIDAARGAARFELRW
jgi:hypothetical protein